MAALFTGVFAGLNVSALLLPGRSCPLPTSWCGEPGRARTGSFPGQRDAGLSHDIPFIRRSDWEAASPMTRPRMIADRLKERKAVIIEDVGVVATAADVEQAYIGFSTIIHTTLVNICSIC